LRFGYLEKPGNHTKPFSEYLGLPIAFYAFDKNSFANLQDFSGRGNFGIMTDVTIAVCCSTRINVTF